jgi:type IV secretory pathway VirB2 component (pilin)
VLSDGHNTGEGSFMVVVIWIAIAVINVMFGRRDFR